MSDHAFFMAEALGYAEKALSKGEFPVGCVLVCDNNVIVTGAREGTAASDTNEVDHAEMVALRRLSRRQQSIDPHRITAYCTLEPCLMCYGAMLIAGIHHIVYAYEDAMGGGTRCELASLPALYRNAKVLLVPHILRTQSLRLFKTYFSNPSNTYLSGTYLAEYTKRQPMAR